MTIPVLPLPIAGVTSGLLGILMAFLSLFLIFLVLLQRGKGGGLAGALGGPGGQSAFGSKAGDTFTVITIVVASVWGFVCAFTMWLLGTHAPSVADTPNLLPGPGEETAADVDPINLDDIGLALPTTDGGSDPVLSGPDAELTPADSDEAPAADADSEPDAAADAP